MRPCLRNKIQTKGGGVAQVVDFLPGMLEALRERGGGRGRERKRISSTMKN
jgi:hypothetical protein